MATIPTLKIKRLICHPRIKDKDILMLNGKEFKHLFWCFWWQQNKSFQAKGTIQIKTKEGWKTIFSNEENKDGRSTRTKS